MFKVKKVEQPAGSTTNSAAMMVILNREIADLDYPRDVIELFINKDDLTKMKLTLKPHAESWWAGGKYEFSIDIPPEFNIKPPIVKCLTKIYHPNIDFNGAVCLNILRKDWTPAVRLSTVFFGLITLFLDPNPDDPLDKETAEHMANNQEDFKAVVQKTLRGGSYRGQSFPKFL